MSLTKILLISTFLLYSFSIFVSSSNEFILGVPKRCSEFQYKCKNDSSCIPREKFCDRIKDCSDGSDEYPDCLQNKTCMHYEFKCKNKYCVNLNKLCDGVNDCQDNSDETDHCSGPLCGQHPHLCDQRCEDTEDSYRCYCDKGYRLQSDNKTCKIESSELPTLLVYSTEHTINGIEMPSMNEVKLVTDVSEVLSVTADTLYTYWSVETNKKNAIYRSLKYQDRQESIITSGLGYVEEIAIDWITTNIYFVDSLNRNFGACNNIGSFCTLIPAKFKYNPMGLTLDPPNGMMYWSEWGLGRGIISMANMNGKNYGVLVKDHIQLPQAITIDYAKRRLYWVDGGYKFIQSIQLDGKNRRKILSTDTHNIHSIAVFEDRLYWSNYNLSTIESCNKLNGSDIRIVKRGIDRVRGMNIFHPLLQPDPNNPCQHSKCSEICLLAGNDSFTCACTLDKQLDTDNLSCKKRDDKTYLWILTKSLYLDYYGKLIGRPSFIPNKSFNHFTAAAYDPLNQTIFVNDIISSSILRYDFKTQKIQKLNNVNNQKVGGISFDYIGKNLYWSNVHQNTIEVYNVETQRKTTLYFLDEPRNLIVIPEFNEMVVAFCKHSGCRLDKISMDGKMSKINTIVTGLVGPIISIAYDDKLGRIFWTDEDSGNLGSFFLNGTNSSISYSNLVHPVSVSIFNNEVYWTLRNNSNLFKVREYSLEKRSYITEIPLSLYNVEMVHLLTANNFQNKFTNPCETENSNCSHICLLSSSDERYKCACPNELMLNSNNKTCEVPMNCMKHQHKCSDNSCIHISKMCDGNSDCPDSRDEANCSNYISQCPKNTFECNNGACISEDNLCNGKNDCGDFSDEAHCSQFMCTGKRQFKCNSSNICIPTAWRCDGQKDCSDGSDEESNCDTFKCPTGLHSCQNNLCVDTSLMCNYDDCKDQIDCSLLEKKAPLSVGCEINNYKCLGIDECISMELRCDNYQDCPKNDDEQFCHRCGLNQFMCTDFRCIHKDKVCDQYEDCDDGSDEFLCNSKKEILPTINFYSKSNPKNYTDSEKFDCGDGKLLSYKNVCDDIVDCDNHADEGNHCSNFCFKNMTCEHHCEITLDGPTCFCADGYRLKADKKTCEDIDECKLGICSQFCKNTEGSYECSCLDGFFLRSDKKSCKIIDNTVEIFTTVMSDIRKYSKNFRQIEVLKRLKENITGLDINIEKQLIYWSIEKEGTITELNLKTNSIELITTKKKPNILSVDWITNNVYFYNNKHPHSIMVCSPLKRKCSTIVNIIRPGNLTAMTVDPINNFIFWAQTTSNNNLYSSIYRTNLNGSDVYEIADGKIGLVNSIVIDYDRFLIFWSDLSQGIVEKANLDGTKRVIHRQVHQPMALNIYDNSLYWVMSSTKQLYACPLLKEVQCQPIDINPSDVDSNLIISHSTRQPRKPNPCESYKCYWMCTIGEDEKPTCICRDGDVQNNSFCVYEGIQQIKPKRFTKHTYIAFLRLEHFVGITMILTFSCCGLLFYCCYHRLLRRIRPNINNNIRVMYDPAEDEDIVEVGRPIVVLSSNEPLHSGRVEESNNSDSNT